VYKTKTANAAIKSDILGFVVQRAVVSSIVLFIVKDWQAKRHNWLSVC